MRGLCKVMQNFYHQQPDLAGGGGPTRQAAQLGPRGSGGDEGPSVARRSGGRRDIHDISGAGLKRSFKLCGP